MWEKDMHLPCAQCSTTALVSLDVADAEQDTHGHVIENLNRSMYSLWILINTFIAVILLLLGMRVGGALFGWITICSTDGLVSQEEIFS